MSRTRRHLLEAGLLAGGALVSAPYIKARPADRPLRIALVGIGRRAFAHYPWLAEQEVVALCDVDPLYRTQVPQFYRDMGASPSTECFPKAAFYTDYRELFESRDDFDAVVVCTPDIHHYPVVMRALGKGKAVFCEKPLAFTPWEAQTIAATTSQLKLPTQMGNQGMASVGWRLAHAYYHAGAIGEVREVHSWIEPSEYVTHEWILPTATEAQPVPDGLNWDVWNGPAPFVPYVKGRFHPGMWRKWVDRGGGRLGDFGCHTMNAMFKVFGLAYPDSVGYVAASAFNGQAYPAQRVVKWTFPPNGIHQGLTSYWYDGGLKPPRPGALEEGRAVPDSGCFIIGDKGVIHVNGSHNDSAALIPESSRRAFGKPKLPVPTGRPHHLDFVDAAKGILPWNAPLSNFTYAGPMTSTVLMPNAMLRNGISQLAIDPGTGAAKDSGQNAFLTYQPRPGWYPDAG